jgi:hypothetical protein
LFTHRLNTLWWLVAAVVAGLTAAVVVAVATSVLSQVKTRVAVWTPLLRCLHSPAQSRWLSALVARVVPGQAPTEHKALKGQTHPLEPLLLPLVVEAAAHMRTQALQVEMAALAAAAPTGLVLGHNKEAEGLLLKGLPVGRAIAHTPLAVAVAARLLSVFNQTIL